MTASALNPGWQSLAWLLLGSAVLFGCTPSREKEGRSELFQCLANAVPESPTTYLQRVCSHVTEAQCDVVKRTVEVNRDRACVGVRWSIPRKYSASHTTKRSSNDIFRMEIPPRDRPSEPLQDERFLAGMRVDHMVDGDIETSATRSAFAYQIRGPAREWKGYSVREGERGSDGIGQALLWPASGDHYLICRTREIGREPLTSGSCEVVMAYRSVIGMNYFIPASDIERASEYNDSLRAVVDGFMVQQAH